jgi:hypothetical protein
MDTTVSATPEDVLSRLEAWFVRDWTFGGALSRPTPSTSQIYATRRTLIDSFSGLLVLTTLTIITASAFLWIYLIYFLVMIDRTYVAQVVATPEARGSRITVRSNRGDWQRELERWVEREFPA